MKFCCRHVFACMNGPIHSTPIGFSKQIAIGWWRTTFMRQGSRRQTYIINKSKARRWTRRWGPRIYTSPRTSMVRLVSFCLLCICINWIYIYAFLCRWKSHGCQTAPRAIKLGVTCGRQKDSKRNQRRKGPIKAQSPTTPSVPTAWYGSNSAL